jgi:peroxiredoxin Q/BCP
MRIGVGQPVPNFSALATGEQTLQLSALRGHWVVLYFYPRDNTPGCTIEAQQFRELHDRFSALNTLILGISGDSLRSHDRFRNTQQLPFHLIADSDHALCQLFAVFKLKKAYGKETLGIERSTFLIDPEGVLRQEWRKVKIDGHASAVLAAIANDSALG